jgi:hypothetical protein
MIQGLLQFYNKYMFSSLTKTKDLLMASIGKVAFNINGLMIHLSVEHTYAKIIIWFVNLVVRHIKYTYMLI